MYDNRCLIISEYFIKVRNINVYLSKYTYSEYVLN